MASITHIITGLNVGGAERALHTLLTNGLEGPFRNHVVSLMGPGHYGPLLQEAGIPVTCLHMRPGRPALRAAIRAQPPRIIQGWMTHGNLSANPAAHLYRRCAKLARVWLGRCRERHAPRHPCSHRSDSATD